MIKISVPNDDHVALRAMAKALEEIAVARGAPLHDEALQQLHNDIQISVSELLKKNPGKVAHTDEVPEFVKETGAHALAEALNNGQQTGVLDVTTDSTGTPWDERIHSASKALNADGTWRLRRKPKDMDEAEWSDYVDMIKADLQYPVECGGQEPDDREQEALDAIRKATDDLNNGVPVGEAVSPLAQFEPSVTPEGDDFHVDAGVVTEQQVASFPPPPPVPVPVVQAALEKGMERYGDAMSKLAENDGAPSLSFPQVMAFLTERHGRITSAQVDQIIADMGLEKITDLNTKPEHTGPFIARVKALLGE